MKKIIIAVACLLVLAGAWLFTTVALARQVRVATRHSHVIEDFKWTYHLLGQDETAGRLREFLKARLYYLGMKMPPERLCLFPNVDFGPVDEAVLGSCLAAPPHADSPNEHRQIMLSKLKERGVRTSP